MELVSDGERVLGKTKKVREQMVEMAAQQCECDNTIELYPLK